MRVVGGRVCVCVRERDRDDTWEALGSRPSAAGVWCATSWGGGGGGGVNFPPPISNTFQDRRLKRSQNIKMYINYMYANFKVIIAF